MIKGVRESVASVLVFAAVLAMLVSIDPRVRARFVSLAADPTGSAITPLGDRLSDLSGALWLAAKDQSIENAPLLIFSVIGALLVLFMVRT